MKIEFEAVAGRGGETEEAKARYRLWETNESWSFSETELAAMLDGNSEVDGKVLEKTELEKGLAAIRSNHIFQP